MLKKNCLATNYRRTLFIVFTFIHLTGCSALPITPQNHDTTTNGLDRLQTIVIIYGENRSFDNLYGLYPGANGIAAALASGHYLQTDHDGTVLPTLPPIWKTKAVNTADTSYPINLPNKPFRIDAAPINKPLSIATRDLVHDFYQNQEQIHGGKNDRFAAISNAGALTMGYYDGSGLAMWKIAQQYTLADNFFMGAFGGSFLNHQWLICACTPVFKDAPDRLHVKFDAQGHLLRSPTSPNSALQGPPQYVRSGTTTPDGYVVSTAQPPYQPSGLKPSNNNPAFADPSGTPLPPQTSKTIGDTLSDKSITWAWYSGGWNQALGNHSNVYGGHIKFQAHHQPFNYFARFAPGTADRAQHLKDEADLLTDIQQDSLPQVVFYKPVGIKNEHPGYANVTEGDQHIADLVKKLQASKQWNTMAIIVTYDENGGFWDHAAPPLGDRWGPGTRIPTIIISPFAKKGFVDHTLYDTTSILKLLTRRFHLEALPGVRQNMGDLTPAFDFELGVK